MTLTQRLTDYVRACFTGLWIETQEPEEALAEIIQLCRKQQWRLAAWDIDRGLTVIGQGAEALAATDPLSVLRSVSALADPQGTSILVLKNFHRFLQSTEILQALSHQVIEGKARRTFLVILAPVVSIPIEIEKLFVVLEHQLPDREQLSQIVREIASEPGDIPDDEALERVYEASAGLTRYEAEGAYSLSLIRSGTISADVIWELKSQTLKKSGLLELHRGQETFADLGGLEGLKEFCRRVLRPRPEGSAFRPRGILLLSPPGCGKSQFAKALGNELGRPTVLLDVGSLMGSLVGQTEQNVRKALQIADAIAPCILFCDEIEKALSGLASSGQTDSGVSARLFGTLLTWLNDHTSDVFFCGSCNDISKLPPEFSRAERFDGVFFIDLPGAKQKQAIWEMYLANFGLKARQAKPVDTNWTGAEIRACCRLAALLDLSLLEAGKQIVPVAVTAAESVDRLALWASGRCLSADQVGIYRRDEAQEARRRVSRPASSN